MLTLTTDQMKRAEQLADESGISYAQLMENAGRIAYRYLTAKYELGKKRCAILVGNGNNGGDGFVIARHMLEAGTAPVILLCAGMPKTTLAVSACNRVLEAGAYLVDVAREPALALGYLRNAQLIVDAVFGTGFHGSLPPEIAELLENANASTAARVALDIPSGMNADTGEASEGCFRAGITLAFGARKPAHSNLLAKEICGAVEVLDIGIPARIIDLLLTPIEPITAEMVCALLPERSLESHKGNYGRLVNIAGSRRMGGAAMMSTLSAMRSGAGIVTLATPESVARTVAPALMEAMTLPLPETAEGTIGEASCGELVKLLSAATGCVIGCGLSLGVEVKKALKWILKEAKCPLVLDADALNCISTEPFMLNGLARIPILTPHMSEMARLSGMTTPQVVENAVRVARLFAKEKNVVVVLKGHRTIIAAPDGSIYRNTTGNAGLAKGGSGDVLAGIIGAFAAQGMEAKEAAICGVFLHGLAADRLAKRMSEYSMLARDVINELPYAFKQIGR